MVNQYPTLSDALQKLIGTVVTSVDFVEDYVQLGWERSFLTAYTMPTIATETMKYCQSDTEYREIMYQLEGKIVETAEVLGDESVKFLFAGGTILSISTRDSDYVGPEAVLYQEIGGLLWVV